eukprot:6405708-Lingulodinium_polyedra.AAC.1
MAEAASSSRAASSKAVPVQEVHGPIQKDDQDVKELRKKCRNTLFLAIEALARPDFKDLVARIFLLCQPLYSAHTQTVKQLKGKQGAQQWYLGAAQGSWLKPLGE